MKLSGLSLRPRDTTFFDLFTEAAQGLVGGAELVRRLLAAPPADRAAIAEQLREAEHRADDVTHRIFSRVNTTFVTPIDREDIHRLTSRLDDVMDFMEAAGDLVVLYAANDLPAEVTEVADVLVAAATLTAESMPKLRSMKGLEAYWIEINRLENAADQLYRQMLARLFRNGSDALTVMKVKEVIDQLESAADAFEHVADTVQTIVAKES